MSRKLTVDEIEEWFAHVWNSCLEEAKRQNRDFYEVLILEHLRDEDCGIENLLDPKRLAEEEREEEEEEQKLMDELEYRLEKDREYRLDQEKRILTE
jgi:hypothetical protein